MKNKYIAVTIGDIDGIGIELLIDLFLSKRIKNFVLFTNKNILKNYFIKNNIKIKINIINKKNKFKNISNEILVYDYKANNKIENTHKSLEESYNEVKKKNYIGIITLPLNKEKINKKIDSKFSGHTEFFEKIDQCKDSNMIFKYRDIFISTITTHIPINSISKNIKKKDLLYNKLFKLNNSLINDFKYKKPKIIISGLNPHAGENGIIGNEEIKYIIPEIKKLQEKKIDIQGPFSGDSIFTLKNRKRYDCFVFLFHDQALIPFKMISKNRGINITGSLNIIRVSPDHGTAYDQVGTGKGNNKSLLYCFKTIKQIYRNRLNSKID